MTKDDKKAIYGCTRDNNNTELLGGKLKIMGFGDNDTIAKAIEKKLVKEFTKDSQELDSFHADKKEIKERVGMFQKSMAQLESLCISAEKESDELSISRRDNPYGRSYKKKVLENFESWKGDIRFSLFWAIQGRALDALSDTLFFDRDNPEVYNSRDMRDNIAMAQEQIQIMDDFRDCIEENFDDKSIRFSTNQIRELTFEGLEKDFGVFGQTHRVEFNPTVEALKSEDMVDIKNSMKATLSALERFENMENVNEDSFEWLDAVNCLSEVDVMLERFIMINEKRKTK